MGTTTNDDDPEFPQDMLRGATAMARSLLKPHMDAAANDNDREFSQDLLRTAALIALFLFGSREMTRRVYHLAATSNLPVFKLGSILCARRSTLTQWIIEQELKRRGPGTNKRA